MENFTAKLSVEKPAFGLLKPRKIANVTPVMKRPVERVRVSDYLALYYMTPVVVIGLFTNLLVIVVMKKIRLPHTTKFFYILIASFDAVVLAINHFGLQVLQSGVKAATGGSRSIAIDATSVTCKTISFVVFFCEGCVAYFTALFAFDRLMRMQQPTAKLRHQAVLQLVTIVMVVNALINSVIFLMFDLSETGRCDVVSHDHWVRAALVVLHTSDALVPGVALMILNTLLCIAVRNKILASPAGSNSGSEAESEAGSVVQAETEVDAGSRTEIDRDYQSQLHREVESVAAVIFSSAVYVVLYIPCCVAHVGCAIGGMGSSMCSMQHMLIVLTTVTHACKFFIYFYRIRTFRLFVVSSCRISSIKNARNNINQESSTSL